MLSDLKKNCKLSSIQRSFLLNKKNCKLSSTKTIKAPRKKRAKTHIFIHVYYSHKSFGIVEKIECSGL